MAKYGFSTTIPYGSDLFEVTGVEYCQWEDALEGIDEGDNNAIEWATYDVLMNNGYLVSEPDGKRPNTEKNEKTTKTTKTAKTKRGGGENVVDTASLVTGEPKLVSGETREPVWTQSRILAERDKLLREREKIFNLKEKALTQKIVEQQVYERLVQEEKADSYTIKDYAAILFGLAVIIIFGLFFIAIKTL